VVGARAAVAAAEHGCRILRSEPGLGAARAPDGGFSAGLDPGFLAAAGVWTGARINIMSEADARSAITVRCPPELEAILLRPVRAMLGLHPCFKAMPHSAFSALLQAEQLTVKKCPPFIDAMTYGFLMPLVADIHVSDGTFAWDLQFPRNPV